jgi:two-component system, NarL family, sensor histidine kinase UhpB
VPPNRLLVYTILTCLVLAFAGRARAQSSRESSSVLGGSAAFRDSVAILKVNAAFRLVTQNPDSALGIAEKGLLQSQQPPASMRLAAFSYKTRGWAWLHKGGYDKAFPDLLRSLQLFRQLHDTLEEMYMDVNLGIAYSNHSQFVNSASYLFMADSLTKILHDNLIEAEVKRQMGILYREQGEYKKATVYFRESIDMFRAGKDTIMSFDAVTSLCLVYMHLSQPDSALKLLNENVNLLDAMQGHNYEKAMMRERYGDAFLASSKYDLAMESYRYAYRVFAADNNKADMAYEAMNLGKTYGKLKKYHDAEDYLLISYRLSDSLKIASYAGDAAGQLADLYETTGQWHKAYHWLDKANSLQDSLELTAQKDKTAQLQAQYEAEKKDREISLLKEDQELNRVIAQRHKVFQYGAIITVILLLLIGFLVINRYRIVQRSRRLIELEKMRNNIARDLHDDMGSALSSIHIISKVAFENGGERQAVNEQLKKIHENSGSVLENMSDIVWTINPANDTLEKVLFKMNEFAADLFEPLNICYTFSQSLNFHHIKLGIQTRKDLYLVFKEAVNNIAKYSQCTEVWIIISECDRQIEMQIKDNGIGFDRNVIRSGNGLKNMEERARQFNGALTISSGPGQGTTIVLKLRSHD